MHTILQQLAFAAALFFMVGCATAPETAIYLVRHAEPDYSVEGDRNPRLNEVGKQRAQALADLLNNQGITRVMSSDFHRTRETAGPLADAVGQDVVLYNPFELEAFADSLKAMSGKIVVVGHSNTTPKLVELLGGDPGVPIDEKTEFDRIYTVMLKADGSVVTRQERYGE